MPICYRCGKSLRPEDVVELKTVCPYCMVDITVRLCPECAKTVVAELRRQLKAKSG